jgi:hypothetical protein
MMTGRAWEALPEETKFSTSKASKDVLGLAEHSLPPGSEARHDLVENTQAKGFNSGDYVKKLDKLYAERENLNIVVPFAYVYVTKKLRGMSTAHELEQMLIEL